MQYKYLLVWLCTCMWGASMAQAATSTPQIAGGVIGNHTLAVRADGTAWAWGRNDHGQLGLGNLTPENSPQQITTLSNVIDIAGGEYHSLALRRNGTVWAWGRNHHGQLGFGDLNNRSTPEQIPGLTDVIAVASGEEHSLAIKRDGTLWVWGGNGDGQLGLGDTTDRDTPQQVRALSDVIAVAGGAEHTLALLGDGTVWTWGLNDFGQLGLGHTNNRNTPRQIQTLSEIVSVTAGGFYSLALHRNGTVSSWGLNTFGQLGLGTFTTTPNPTPQQIPDLGNVIAVIGGNGAVLALKRTGRVFAWGANDVGQLGLGTTRHHNTPQLVPGITDVVSLARGGTQSIVLRSDGSAWGWGRNDEGQLGVGNNDHPVLQPIQLAPRSHVPSTFNPDPLDLGRIARGVATAAENVEFGLEAGDKKQLDFDPKDVLASGAVDLVRYQKGSCQSGQMTGPSTCELQIIARPRGGIGLQQGLLTIPATGTFARAVLLPVVANVTGAFLWADTRAPYDFGVQDLNSNTNKRITFKNRGDADVTIRAVILAGNQFSILRENCEDAVLKPGDSCGVTTRFTPTAGGLLNQSLIVRSDDAGARTINIGLRGTGDAPRLSFSGPLDFGDVTVGESSRLTVTLRNRGTKALNITRIREASTQFRIVNNACGARLAVDDTCEVEIAFRPRSVGAKTATLDVTSNDPQQATRSVELRGNGIN